MISGRILIKLRLEVKEMDFILWMTVLSGTFIAIFAEKQKCKKNKC